MRVPILTYHAMNITGNDYSDNDHVAFAEDLRLIHRLDLRIVPVARVVSALLGETAESELENCVALSCDDGAWFDWYDLDHPTFGPQRGFAGILRDFNTATGADVHATSFVIVSPDARAVLDLTCMVGRGWWGGEWWPLAAEGDLIAIESHSWDHNHPTLPVTAQHDQRKGTFKTIETYADADAELRQASDWLDAHCPARRTRLFAYPWGESNDYLLREYLPQYIAEHRLHAAFATEPRPVDGASDRWLLPRYVCGQHWRTPDQLERLLRDAA